MCGVEAAPRYTDPAPNRVVLTVDGGVVQAVNADRPAEVDVTILDFDVDGEPGADHRWWVCPQCSRSHRRGFFPLGYYGSHRCLNCGYVGDSGIMHTNRPAPRREGET